MAQSVKGFSKTISGFTLIELSIVLVIIGLIIGGVLVGRDLIRAAEIRATISQIEKYNTSVNTFRVKYNGLPGDLHYKQAQELGFYYITNASLINANYVGGGDGNGFLNNTGCGYQTTICNQTYLMGEPLMFWRHLSESKLIDGNYGINLDDAGGSSNVDSIDIVNQYIPPAKSGQGASIEANSLADRKNYFLLTVEQSFWAQGGHLSSSNALTARDAYAIDIKIDNGIPSSGNIVAIDSTGDYSLDSYTTWTTVSAVAGCVSAGAYALNPGTTPGLQPAV